MQGGHYHHPPPPPPPPPPDDRDDDDETESRGMPRCYFCGRRFQREEDIRKTQHHIGNNYKKYVFVCRECDAKGVASTGCMSAILVGLALAFTAAVALAAL